MTAVKSRHLITPQSLSILLTGLLLSSIVAGQQVDTVHHSLRVTIDPLSQAISVQDTITLPDNFNTDSASFLLNSNLRITRNTAEITASGSSDSSTATGINSTGADAAASTRYSLGLSRRDGNRFMVTYDGIIAEQTSQNSAQYSQSFSETSGIINEQGVYLGGASMWIPGFESRLVTFDLQVEFSDEARDWTAVSQGRATGINAWAESQPMEEIYLIAANFERYELPSGDTDMLVYLRQPDPNLAARYLDATERYLALYEPLLGEYPYSKFALIENFWETGYGMPSFTLLGQQIIRFPFIIDSSYPHEILHNWWGNGVYPDYESGNWSEGLTTYLADHLFQEMDGLGSQYRKDNLIRYKNYVASDTDFPLSDFTSRSSAATQAVGYGKTLMLWHMLRQNIGDELFLQGLRQLYEEYKFRQVGFADIAQLFSTVSQQDLTPFFDQWVNRTGAPVLQLSVSRAAGNLARIMFAQTQPGEPYSINLPVALYYNDRPEPEIYDISLTQKFEGVLAENADNLQAIVVDPYFDIFRQLDREEIPPVLGQLFGSTEVSFIVPQANRSYWLELAQAFSDGLDANILMVEDVVEFPPERSVWVLGKNNPFLGVVQESAQKYGVTFDNQGLELEGQAVPFSNRSSVLATGHPSNPELAIGWIHVEDMAAMPGMIEKLPHYGKYSFLSFTGSEPTNDISGNWVSDSSPMLWLADDLPAGFRLPAPPPREALTTLPPRYPQQSLLQHVQTLSAAPLQGRLAGSNGARMAADYIAGEFADAGLQMLGDSYIHTWIETTPDRGELQLANIIGVLPGSNRQLADKPLVIGAHFDHLGTSGTDIYFGADDNASGVSVLLEVASRLAGAYSPGRTVIFVAFDGEEAGLLGSGHFVANPPAPIQSGDFYAMLNLDSVGRMHGRELQIFGADSAYEWPFMAQGIGFTIGVNAVLADQVIASSDHVSFLNNGVPAIHLFGGVHSDFHQPTDTPDKLDLNGMSDLALWLEEAIVYLADREEPLRSNLSGATVTVSGTNSSERQASLGTVPDFAWSGSGVRLGDVVAGGVAEQAGIQSGDILLRYNSAVVTDLQQYSDLLRGSAPGDVVELLIEREGLELVIPVTLGAR